MIVRFHGMLSGLSPSHVNAESMTTDFGSPAASLSVVGSKSSFAPPTLYAKSALLHLIAPLIAFAYGSTRSLAGF